jgi:hypothetical protein
MSKITKLLFSVSEQGNPIARLWLDDADITKNSEAIVLGIRSQVAYAFFLNIGAEVETKKSKQYTNIDKKIAWNLWCIVSPSKRQNEKYEYELI